MFDANDEQYLIRHIGLNNVVLFLGAGFTRAATNFNDENLPLGGELAKKIWEFLGFDGEYSGDPLHVMYDALVKGKSQKQILIKSFLEEHFLVKDVPEYFELLTKVYWYRIYTTNIDDAIQIVYKKSRTQRLRTLRFPTDQPEERDQFLDSVQIIHMHGLVPCDPRDVIFSTGQYAQGHIRFLPFYYEFIQDFATRPTIFIGSKLEEPIFWQYIEERKSRVSGGAEKRPRSFVIAPQISQPRRIQLKEYNVVPVEGTAKDFLEWLGGHVDELWSKEQIIKRAHPRIAEYFKLEGYRDYRKELGKFSLSFEKVMGTSRVDAANSDFLLGVTPTWGDIYKDLDAPRNITKQLKSDVTFALRNEKELRVLALVGNAGSGKSTILKRLGVSLAQDANLVFFTNSEELPNPQTITEVLTLMGERSVLLFDNAETVLNYLPVIVKETENLEFAPIIVFASRTNDFDRMTGKYKSLVEMAEYSMQPLERDEIEGIIGTLDQNGLLGYLQGLSKRDRIREFEVRAKKQLLVSMREATTGYGFDEILKNEFESVSPTEAKTLCSIVALASHSGYSLTREELISLSEFNPGDTLVVLERNLQDIVKPEGPSSNKYWIRHRTIADYLVKQAIPKQVLVPSYVRLLTKLAVMIRGKRWNSRTFKLYRDLISHTNILTTLNRDVGEARLIYDGLKELFSDEYHFWLQYGSLELEAGSLTHAENYLNQAKSLNLDDRYVETAIGHLLLKKGVYASSYKSAAYYRKEGEEILFDVIQQYGSIDAYCYQIYCHQSYNWIRKWIVSDNSKKEELSELVAICKAGHRAHPRNRIIDATLEIIQRALLNLGIEPSKRPEDPEIVI